MPRMLHNVDMHVCMYGRQHHDLLAKGLLTFADLHTLKVPVEVMSSRAVGAESACHVVRGHGAFAATEFEGHYDSEDGHGRRTRVLVMLGAS